MYLFLVSIFNQFFLSVLSSFLYFCKNAHFFRLYSKLEVQVDGIVGWVVWFLHDLRAIGYREPHISDSFNLRPNKSSAQSWSTPYTSELRAMPWSGFCFTLIFMHDKAHKRLLTKMLGPPQVLHILGHPALQVLLNFSCVALCRPPPFGAGEFSLKFD